MSPILNFWNPPILRSEDRIVLLTYLNVMVQGTVLNVWRQFYGLQSGSSSMGFACTCDDNTSSIFEEAFSQELIAGVMKSDAVWRRSRPGIDQGSQIITFSLFAHTCFWQPLLLFYSWHTAYKVIPLHTPLCLSRHVACVITVHLHLPAAI